jgi:lysophospholipase L1-like esterase
MITGSYEPMGEGITMTAQPRSVARLGRFVVILLLGGGPMTLRRSLRGLLVVLLSFAVFLAMLEVTLQIYTRAFTYYDVEMSRYAVNAKRRSENPKIGHVHRPNVSMKLMGVDVRINSDGLRDREYDVARGESYRIIALGDSLTFGWGVDEADCFVTLLEHDIGQTTPVELINFGNGNYNTEQQVNLFFEKGLKYDPDAVVVFFFINDAEPTPVRSNWLGLTRLRSLTSLWSRARTLQARWGSADAFGDYYRGLYQPDRPGWLAMTDAFRELRDECREKGIALQVILLPEFHNLADYPFVEQHRQVGEFLRREGVNFKDLVQDFSGVPNSRKLWVAPDDAHPNASAHRMIADHSRSFLEQEIAGR